MGALQDSLRLLYRQEQLPVFQNRCYDTAESARNCPKGNIRLVEDLKSGLIYNADFRSEQIVYDSHYQNEQALSPLFQSHLDDVARLVSNTMGSRNLVEVGCGKGFFLEMLLAQGVDIHGFDPTYEGDNPRIQVEYFGPKLGIRADGLILRHVLEHIEDPVEFLFQLKDANGGGGKIYVEVPCFEWICDNRAWFDIYYEHVNYFRLSDFYRMFGTVIHGARLFAGQYLTVVADLASLKRPEIDSTDRVRFPENFGVPRLENSAYRSRRNVVWGGASKGVIFSILRERAGQPVDTVIDINPRKQGRFLPATGLRVYSPHEALPTLPPDTVIYVMNPNYLEEIREMSNNAFTYVEADHV